MSILDYRLPTIIPAINEYKKIGSFLLFFLTLIHVKSYSQDHGRFYKHSLEINKNGMYFLSGWAISNLALGTEGWINSTGERKYFSQMNVAWNLVNLTLAGINLITKNGPDLLESGPEEILRKQKKIEKIFLINAGLDVAYIGTGFLLKERSSLNEQKKDLLSGFGNSLILQGGFLFIFDLYMYHAQKSHRLKFVQNLEIGRSQVGIKMKF